MKFSIALASGVALMSAANGMAADAPVTKAEARTTFIRIEAAMDQALGVKIAHPKLVSGAGNYTRTEFVEALGKLVAEYHAYYKVAPRPQLFYPKALNFPKKSKPLVKQLVVGGFVSPVSWLVVGPKPTMSTTQFGDAVGYFLARWCMRTNMPSTTWTPDLEYQPQETVPTGPVHRTSAPRPIGAGGGSPK